MYDFLLPAFQFVRFWSLQQNFFTGQKRRTHMITDRREFFRIRCQIRDHAGDSAGGAGSFETVDAVLGYHALLQSEPAEETRPLRKSPGPVCCLQPHLHRPKHRYTGQCRTVSSSPSATRRVVEVATATLIECSFSQERNS